ncbi:MAG: VirB8/TrbF family protein [Candidatus Acidiferrales bacterium]
MENVLNDSLNETATVSDGYGDSLYAALHRENKFLRIAAVLAATGLFVSLLANFTLARRKPIVIPLRIDALGRATALQYSSLRFTPRDSEVRSALLDWTRARYALLRATAAKTYQENYYFLEKKLAAKCMRQDARTRRVARVIAGTAPENDVTVNNIQITGLATSRRGGEWVTSGSALIDYTKIFSPGKADSRTEHWTTSVKFYVNPEQVAEQAESDPKYEYINPLGVTITYFHDDRALR